MISGRIRRRERTIEYSVTVYERGLPVRIAGTAIIDDGEIEISTAESEKGCEMGMVDRIIYAIASSLIKNQH